MLTADIPCLMINEARPVCACVRSAHVVIYGRAYRVVTPYIIQLIATYRHDNCFACNLRKSSISRSLYKETVDHAEMLYLRDPMHGRTRCQISTMKLWATQAGRIAGIEVHVRDG